MRMINLIMFVMALAAAGASCGAPARDDQAQDPWRQELDRELKAENLAKDAHTLGAESNEQVIRDSLLPAVKGDIQINGWTVGRAAVDDNDTYLVSYTYTARATPSQRTGWMFEVKVASGLVRNIVGDSELEQRYSVTPSPN